MKTLKLLKFISLIIFFLVLSTIGEASAAIYYIAPNGSDSNNGTSQSVPWATFSHATGVLQPGDTLYLMDGTYFQQLKVKISGTPGNPITFKALNDGQAIIDGNYGFGPVQIAGTPSVRVSYIDIEGIIAKRSPDYVVRVDYSDYINFRRVSVYDGIRNGISIFYTSTHVLVEDCIIRTPGAYPLHLSSKSHLTVRRCYVTFVSSGHGVTWSSVNLYPPSDSIVENVVTETSTGGVNGIMITNGYANTSNNNVIYGSIAREATLAGYLLANAACGESVGQKHINCVSIRSKYGFYQRTGEDWEGRHLTIVGRDKVGRVEGVLLYPNDCPVRVNGDLRDSSLLTGTKGLALYIDDKVDYWTHSYNNLYDFNTNYAGTTQGTGETFIDPAYDTVTYGDGAYLFVPPALKGQGEGGADIGAEVLYRYVDGVLTTDPLWPWPMEGRIQDELGISLTYETDPVTGKTGGLWKTLEGVYEPDTEVPSTPTNLQATAISESQIDLSWTAATDNRGISGYNIYRNGSFLTSTTNTAYSNTGLSSNTYYTYRVSAVDASNNESNQSTSASATTLTPDTTAPSIPTDLAATVVSPWQTNLSWTVATDNRGVTGYNIYRNGIYLDTSADTSFTDTGLTPNTSYTYTVSALDAANNESMQSTQVSITTLDAPPVTQNGLVAYWKFDEGSGTTAGDSSGNGNDGTLTGTPGPEWTTGKIGGALSFDGTDDLVDVADEITLDIPTSNGFTVGAWIKLSDVTDYRIIVDKRSEGTWEGYYLYVRPDGKMRFGIEDIVDNNPVIIGTTNVADGNWHYVVGVRDVAADKVRLYVDGSEDAPAVTDTTTGSLDSNHSLMIGRYTQTANYHFLGLIDDVRIYNRALSATEILSNYASQPPQVDQNPPHPPTGLLIQ